MPSSAQSARSVGHIHATEFGFCADFSSPSSPYSSRGEFAGLSLGAVVVPLLVRAGVLGTGWMDGCCCLGVDGSFGDWL